MVADGAQRLPDNWERKTVGDIVTFEYGKGLTQSKRDSNGKVPVYGSNGIVGYHSSALIDKPCLIVGRKGAAGAVHKSEIPCWPIDTTYYVIPPDNANLSFLYYLFSSLNFPSLDRSTAIPGLNRNDAYDVEIPFPPLPEQERIVSRIEELFSDLDAGVAALERVQIGLQRYKASVIKAAVEGKLFESKEAWNNDELPIGWQWSTVAELAAKEKNSITDGPFGSKLKTEHYQETGPRVIRLQNIGDIDFRDAMAHISQEHFETLRKHQIFAGDLVIAGLGESLPRACIIPEYVGDAIVKADCIRFKPNQELADNKYLLYALNSETIKKLVTKIVHGIGRPRMNQQEIKAIPIPLAPLDEQRRIVAEVERRLSVVGEVESAVDAGLVRAARLRQSVLRSAFEGRL